jgi:hypothetical protein
MENRLIIQKTILAQILPKKPFASTDSIAIRGAERTTLSFDINSISPIVSPSDIGA